jgi:hypothetical protein
MAHEKIGWQRTLHDIQLLIRGEVNSRLKDIEERIRLKYGHEAAAEIIKDQYITYDYGITVHDEGGDK